MASDITGVTNRGINLSGASSVFDVGHTAISEQRSNGTAPSTSRSNITVGTVTGGRLQINGDGSQLDLQRKLHRHRPTRKTRHRRPHPHRHAEHLPRQLDHPGGMIINGGDTLPDAFPIFVQPTSTLTLHRQRDDRLAGQRQPDLDRRAIVDLGAKR